MVLFLVWRVLHRKKLSFWVHQGLLLFLCLYGWILLGYALWHMEQVKSPEVSIFCPFNSSRMAIHMHVWSNIFFSLFQDPFLSPDWTFNSIVCLSRSPYYDDSFLYLLFSLLNLLLILYSYPVLAFLAVFFFILLVLANVQLKCCCWVATPHLKICFQTREVKERTLKTTYNGTIVSFDV